MPVNLVKEFFNFAYALALYSRMNYETLQGYFQIVQPRRPFLFRQKMLPMLRSTSTLMQ